MKELRSNQHGTDEDASRIAPAPGKRSRSESLAAPSASPAAVPIIDDTQMRLHHHDVARDATAIDAPVADAGGRTPAERLPAAGRVAPVQCSPAALARHEDPFAMHLICDAVQARGGGGHADHVHAAAAQGLTGAGGALPFLDQIQASFGEHDVSHVQAHVGGPAADASRAIGAEAYATGDHVAFGSAPDLHTAAHEAAHVVQQHRGVQLKGGVGEVGDAYERHADEVADAVVRGDSAAELLGDIVASAPSIQRKTVQFFGALEHKDLGDMGSGGASYERKGLELTHGDLVMLRGDHFTEADIQALWNRPSTMPGKRPNTQDELIYAIHLATEGTDPRFNREDSPWFGLTFSDGVKKNVDDRYLALAAKNDDHFANPRKPMPGREEQQAGSSPATYRGAHERALDMAYRAGSSGGSLDDAMVVEAMGQHFLTDAFASGHIDTQRTSIRDHWNHLYPHFFAQFKAKVSRDMARHLKSTAVTGMALIPNETYQQIVAEQIEGQLAGAPEMTLGDLVALVAHDYDNSQGLWVVNDVGYRWYATGDGSLREPPADDQGSERSHMSVVLEAVQAGCDEVRRAHALGGHQKAAPLPREQMLDQMLQRVDAPAIPSTRYAPEQYIPRTDPGSSQAKQYWRSSTIEALWNSNVRDGSPTFGNLIVKGFQSGTASSTLEGIAANLPAKMEPITLAQATLVNHVMGPRTQLAMGYVKPRLSFERAVINRLREDADCFTFIIELLGNT